MIKYNSTFVIFTIIMIMFVIENFNTITHIHILGYELTSTNTITIILSTYLMGFLMGVFIPKRKKAKSSSPQKSLAEEASSEES